LIPEQEDAAHVRIFPPGVPLAAILIGVALQWLWPLDLSIADSSPAHYWIGGLIVCGGFGLGAWAVLLFRQRDQSPNPRKPTPCIEERGPYRITRNPMYLQMVLVCIGFAVILMNGWILALTPVVIWLLQRFAISPEEAYLERKFADEYLAYKDRVRRWL
jgi:protein-S-isoprenylcysteine O-methyltransferase Ste14